MAKRKNRKTTRTYTYVAIGAVLAFLAIMYAYAPTLEKLIYSPGPVPISTITTSTAGQNATGYQGNTGNNITQSLFPQSGFRTKIKLGDLVPRLVASGALNTSKIRALYGNNLTQQELNMLTQANYSNLTLSSHNANFLLLVFWAVGIANKNPILDNFVARAGSSNMSYFASTGGWTLGTDNNSLVYFNKVRLINLTPTQQAEANYTAMHSYRPCCNNPTGFPDCNHGAALLALEELGASQGLNQTELNTLALEAQTLWFPSYYQDTAILLQSKNMSYWGDAAAILDANYSSGSGWYSNVYKPLQEQNLLPQSRGGVSCGA